jgi:hypothetical protein
MRVFCKAATTGRAVMHMNILHLSIYIIQFASMIYLSEITSLHVFASELTVELANSQNVILVGAIQRWDKDGNHRNMPDQKAKIDAPAMDATAEKTGNDKWGFKNLPAGKYDLVIMAKDRIRIEGFQYAPIKEFDLFISPDAAIDDETREVIIDDISKSPHYENKVVPLFMAGDKKAVRVLVMLIRDKPTSYESESPGAATLRHEIWQYSWNYGAWQKEKRTKVMDRVLMPRDQLRTWTWIWDPKLGGIEVKYQSASMKYVLPKTASRDLKGLYPY